MRICMLIYCCFDEVVAKESILSGRRGNTMDKSILSFHALSFVASLASGVHSLLTGTVVPVSQRTAASVLAAETKVWIPVYFQYLMM